ncbi:chaplin family protein [Actinomadura macrotermitis]|uniref:Chaplin domain-containing protein n=1 Tax=Actinomadura macrotermitis TaxID=2585200 RepID=A0A7K0BXP0_9ACTN|nr:hypothetical protein [Actinomadura macrotermitis]
MLKKLAVTGGLGLAVAASALTATPASADIDTTGHGSLLGGNQLILPISVPVNACGNAVAVLGLAKSGGCKGSSAVVSNDFSTHGGYHKHGHH